VHGVAGHGRRFRKLAEESLAHRFHVVAVDLRGHGFSTWDEPWDIAAHVADLLDTVDEPADWIGHSFGGRLTIQVAAVRPDLVRRSVLLDPAIFVPPFHAGEMAEEARQEESYDSASEAIDARAVRSGLAHTPRGMLEEDVEQHGVEREDGTLGLRYSGDCVGEAYMQMATPPPSFDELRMPTLMIVGSLSKLVSAGEVELYRRALGDLLTLEVVPGGHSVLWDAYEETAAAIDAFL
jgi:lipase